MICRLFPNSHEGSKGEKNKFDKKTQLAEKGFEQSSPLNVGLKGRTTFSPKSLECSTKPPQTCNLSRVKQSEGSMGEIGFGSKSLTCGEGGKKVVFCEGVSTNVSRLRDTPWEARNWMQSENGSGCRPARNRRS